MAAAGRVDNREDRIPPHDLQAEADVIAAAILDAEALQVALEALDPGDFYREAHGEMFRALRALHDRGEPVDLSTLSSALVRTGSYDRCGGGEYLTTIVGSVPTTRNAEAYAAHVRECAQLRRLLALSDATADAAYTSGSASDAILRVESMLGDISQSQSRSATSAVPVRELSYQTFKLIEQRTDPNSQRPAGISTGYRALNRLLGGFSPGDLVVLAARPSMGKTSLALNIADRIARSRSLADPSSTNVVAFFSLEVSSERVMEALVSMHARIETRRLRSADTPPTPDEWEHCIGRAQAHIASSGMVLDDQASLSANDVRLRCRDIRRRHGRLDLVVIDYLGRMRATRRSENRNLEVGETVRACKSLALEMPVPVLLLSQLSRAGDKAARAGSSSKARPVLSDLRDSGEIEQEADAVAFIYREGYQDYMTLRDEEQAARQVGSPEPCEVIFAKNRNGPTGTAKLAFVPDYRLFYDLTSACDGSGRD